MDRNLESEPDTQARQTPPLPPLGGQDLSFLAWESNQRPMHIGIECGFEREPDKAPIPPQKLKEALFQRVTAEALLTHRLNSKPFGRMEWTPVAPANLSDHIQVLEAEGHTEERHHLRDEILSRALDREKPLWEIWIDPQPETEHTFLILIKIHHALIDGIAAVGLIERLMGDLVRPASTTTSIQQASPSQAFDARSTLGFVLDQFRSGPASPLNGAVTSRRHHRKIELDATRFKNARLAWNVSGNDLLLGSVCGALREWLRDRGHVFSSAPLRAFCPVSLRPKGPRAPSAVGNQISPWFVPLPLGDPDRKRRLQQIQDATEALKAKNAAGGGAGMARIVKVLGGWVARLGMQIATWRRAFGVVVTNVPGPSQPLYLLGNKLVSLQAFPPLFPGQRVIVAAVHYDQKVFVGIRDGWSSSRDGADFRSALNREFETLLSQTP
ncbi:MAG: wax ester/triacylglycerol synthase domain-containing protein [Myxococcota bacterium]